MPSVDPNIVYLVLLAGLWLTVTAIYVPGTGLIELLAVAAVIGALVMMTNLPINWLAALVMVVGVLSFLTIPLLDQRLELIAVVGLILQTVGGLTLFSDGQSVSFPLIIVTVVAALAYHQFALVPTLKTRHHKPAMLGDEPLVGAEGYVQKPLNPVGTVYVRGESWTARADEWESESDSLRAGTPIAVVEQQGLTLFVQALKQKHQPSPEEA